MQSDSSENAFVHTERKIHRKYQRRRRRQRMIVALVIIIVAIPLIAFMSVDSRKTMQGGYETAAVGKADVDENQTAVDNNKTKTDQKKNAKATEQQSEVTLSAVGDNLISASLLEQAKARTNDGTYDFSNAYADVAKYIGKHEVNWIDVETCINNEVKPAGYPKFSTPGQDGLDLYQAGFNVYSLANNHTYDLLAAGVNAEQDFFANSMPKDTVATGLWTIDSAPQESLTKDYSAKGLHAQPDVKYQDIPVYTCANGKKIAFLSYTELCNKRDGVNGMTVPQGSTSRMIFLYEKDLIQRQIVQARQMADAVVVGCHWGTEGSHEITAKQKEEAQFIADCGADLIIGTHPHVVQDASWITSSDGRKVFCAYSLGNFLSTQQQPDNLLGVVLDCKLRFSEGQDGKEMVTVVSPKLVPIVTDYGENAANAHVELLSDYTDQQAEAHGIEEYLENGTTFDMNYIRNVYSSTIRKEFLTMK